ncbi:hypothetical protein [Paenibacillus maysiensis]|uniref:hypothetical protein n=1 Tax=Paenibacillus maysiensis TaxID=1155954 RepID=UPI001FD7604C|nr:hypothetical protein [Paenibacillus maysiensis]
MKYLAIWRLGPEPERFGLIGLRTYLVPGPVVTFSGSIGLIGELGDTYAIEIVRGADYDPNDDITGQRVYLALQGLLKRRLLMHRIFPRHGRYKRCIPLIFPGYRRPYVTVRRYLLASLRLLFSKYIRRVFI